jgi:hypothetical protein
MLGKTLTSRTPLPTDICETFADLEQTLNAIEDIVEDREHSVEEMRDLGARDGRALAEALASNVPAGVTAEQADSLFQIVVRGIEETTEKLIAGGTNLTLALAYRSACYEAIDAEMARDTRGQDTPERLA